MKTLHITVSDKIATYLKRDGIIVCGNSCYQIQFTFDEEWDAYDKKTARFIWGNHYKNVDFTGDTCPVPSVFNADLLKVGVYAGELSTTTVAEIPCEKSILCHAAGDMSNPCINGDSVFIRYSAHADGTDFTEEWSEGQNYIGQATGQTAPTDKSGYTWSLFKGEKGDAGEVTLDYAHTTFANVLKGTKSGKAVAINDASPVEHNLNVRVSSKNLFPSGALTLSNWTDIGEGKWAYPIELPEGVYFFSCSGVDTEGSGGYFYLQANPKGASDWNVKSQYLVQGRYVPQNSLITIDKRYDYRFWWYGRQELFDKMKNIQLERGTSATEYVPPVSDLTSVTVCKQGKNLIPYPYELTTVTSNGITATAQSDGSIILNGTATAGTSIPLHFKIPLLKKGVYYAIGGGDADVVVNARYYEADDTTSTSWYDSPSQKGYSVQYPEYSNYVYIGIYIPSGKSLYSKAVYPTVCVASPDATSEPTYEPYIAPTEYIPTADGTVDGVMSIAPNTTLTTDNDDVIIDVEYNRDINKAFAELQEAIISLGGNV